MFVLLSDADILQWRRLYFNPGVLPPFKQDEVRRYYEVLRQPIDRENCPDEMGKSVDKMPPPANFSTSNSAMSSQRNDLASRQPPVVSEALPLSIHYTEKVN